MPYRRRETRREPKNFFVVPGIILVILVLLFVGLELVGEVEKRGKYAEFNFLVSSLSPADTIVDVWGLDLYLRNRVAELLTDPLFHVDTFLTYQYAQSILGTSDSSRKAGDLKYAFYDLREEGIHEESSVVWTLLKWRRQANNALKSWWYFLFPPKDYLISSDLKLYELVRKLREEELVLGTGGLVEKYKRLAADLNYQGVHPFLFYRLACYTYQDNPQEALSYLRDLNRNSVGAPKFLLQIAKDLKRQIIFSGASEEKSLQFNLKLTKATSYSNRFQLIRRRLEDLIKGGQLSDAHELTQRVLSDEQMGLEEIDRQRPELIAGYIELQAGRPEDALTRLQSIASDSSNMSHVVVGRYLQLIDRLQKKEYNFFADETSRLADEFDQQAFTSTLRFQTWGTMYYDKKDVEKAEVSLRALKERHPFEAISRPEKGIYLFRRVPKETLQVFNIFKVLFPEAVQVVKMRIGLLAQRLREDELTRRFTEEEFDRFVVTELFEHVPSSIADIRVDIHENGFDGLAQIKMGLFKMTISGSGIIQPDKGSSNELKMELYWMKIGVVPIPRFLLEQLEKIFNESLKSDNFPLHITNMEYEENAVLLTARRTSQLRSGLPGFPGSGVSGGKFDY